MVGVCSCHSRPVFRWHGSYGTPGQPDPQGRPQRKAVNSEELIVNTEDGGVDGVEIMYF